MHGEKDRKWRLDASKLKLLCTDLSPVTVESHVWPLACHGICPIAVKDCHVRWRDAHMFSAKQLPLNCQGLPKHQWQKI